MYRTRRQIIRVLFGGGLAVGIAAACGSSERPAPSPSPSPEASGDVTGEAGPAASTLRRWPYGSSRVIGGMVYYVAIEKGFFRDEGIEMELVPITTFGEAVPYLGTGEVYSASGAFSAAFVNAIRQGIKLTVVANGVALSRGSTFHCFAASKPKFDAGEVRSISDLRGKRIANLNTEGLVAWENEKILNTAGLSLADVQLVRVGAQDMVTALANGSVDAGLLVEPFWVIAKRNNAAVKLLLGDEIYEAMGRDVPIGLIVLSEKILSDESLVVAFLRALLRAARYYNVAMRSPDGREEMLQIALKSIPTNDPTIYREMIWPGVPEDLSFDPTFFDEIQNFMLKRGEISDRIQAHEFINLEFLTKARETLGE